MNRNTLSYIFSFLNIIELTKIREVCKDYYNIANEMFLKIVEKSKKENYYNLCEKGDLITMYLYNKEIDVNKAMYLSVIGRNKDLIEFFISKGANDLEWGMVKAIEDNNKDLVEFFISKGANNWNYGLCESIFNNNKELTEFFISKGASCLDIKTQNEISINGNHNDVTNYVKNKLYR